jgi:hypothetical protein
LSLSLSALISFVLLPIHPTISSVWLLSLLSLVKQLYTTKINATTPKTGLQSNPTGKGQKTLASGRRVTIFYFFIDRKEDI